MPNLTEFPEATTWNASTRTVSRVHPWTEEAGWHAIEVTGRQCRELAQHLIKNSGWSCWIDGNRPDGTPVIVLYRKESDA